MKLRDIKVLVERLDDVKLNRLISCANAELHKRNREKEVAAQVKAPKDSSYIDPWGFKKN